MSFEIFKIIEDQALVGFTGKINLQVKSNSAHVGSIYFLDGKIINAALSEMDSYKSFINLCIESNVNKNIKFVVEPELLTLINKKIDIPFSVLKKKILSVYDEYIKAKKNKPPMNLKILTKTKFLNSNEEVTAQEFKLLCSLSDYSSVKDIYTYSDLLEYEITNTLMSLRKKNAIKLIQVSKE